MELTPRGRTENESRANTIGERHQRFAQDIDESYGLGKQPLQLGEDGCLLVRLKVHLLAANLAANQTGSREQFELALNRADRAADMPDEFPQVVRFVGVTQEPAEYAAARAAEQDGSGVESRRGCSQDGDKRTQNGDARSTIRKVGDLGRCIDIVYTPCYACLSGTTYGQHSDSKHRYQPAS